MTGETAVPTAHTSPAHTSPVGAGRRHRADRAVRVACWCAVAAAVVAGLIWTRTPIGETARFGACWVGGIVVPGVLLARALWGSLGNWPEDIGLGAVTGVAYLLVGWALAVGTGLGDWLWVWPVPVVVAFAAVPGLRRHWRLDDPQPLPLRWTLAITAIMMLAIGTIAVTYWAANPLFPATHRLFGDVYYHWANAAQLRHTIAPTQPQMAGLPLHYHWLSDAHRATMSMVSAVPLDTIMLRLWVAPIVITSVLTVAALGRRAARVWWAGPVAAFVACVVPVVSVWPRFGNYYVSVIPNYSPTLIFSIPFVAAVAFMLVDVARGRRLGRAWPLFVALLIVATGSKASSLPVLIGGTVAATIAAWLIRADGRRGLTAVIGCAIATLLVTAPILAGGTPGAGIQFGSTFTFMAEYQTIFGDTAVAGSGGPLPENLFTLGAATAWFLPTVAACWLIGQAPRLIGLGLLVDRAARRDPAVWLLAGMVATGLTIAMSLSHVANGQMFFWNSAVPAAAALTACLLARVRPARHPATVVGSGLAVGACVGAGLFLYGPGQLGPDRLGPGGQAAAWRDTWATLLLQPVAALAGVAAVGAVLWVLGRLLIRTVARARGRAVARWRVGAAGGLALLVAATIGLGVDTTRRNLAPWLRAISDGRSPTQGATRTFWVTADEMRAAQWLADNAPAGDYVATNVHCELVKTTADCVNRSFWVSALTEHAIVLEGWAYQEAVQARHGADGLPYFRQPAPDLDRWRVNDAAFAAPTAEGLKNLHDAYGARWLFADDRASPVSPTLARLASARQRFGPVTIYELP